MAVGMPSAEIQYDHVLVSAVLFPDRRRHQIHTLVGRGDGNVIGGSYEDGFRRMDGHLIDFVLFCQLMQGKELLC